METDSMYCFSCRLFLIGTKYESRVWHWLQGISNWNCAANRIKSHASSEAHMVSMVMWNDFKKNNLKGAFENADKKFQAAQNEEKQRNREILLRLIDII